MFWKSTIPLMTESVKNSSTSFDKNMPSTNDTKSFTKFSIKFITADMSFVTAKGDISTVTADINKDSNRDATNGNTLGALTAITSTACIGNGESGDSVTSGTSPTNKLEHIEQCSGFSIESIMKEGKESFASELKHKEVSPKIEVRSVEPKSDDREKIETKKTLVYKSTRVSSDNVLTIPESDTNDYTFCDKSSEVKHPQTPLNNVPNQSHSPQLPETAFAYPVQEESISELMSVDGYSVSLPHTTSHKNLSGIDNKTHSAEKKTAHRICARIEHHVNRKSETKVKHVKNNISEPNFVKTKKKKPV
ncbi:hypothetical protein JTB14_014575 [Gonioctena quinquepunctata]|nr:hypothetical protein JTB14_014575 [Gonioctena quinquepunctata]